MSYLYVTDAGAVMGIDGGYFAVNHKDGMVHKIPKETLEAVALFGNASITTACTGELLRRGIPVSYFGARGAYFGRLESMGHKNIGRLKKQIFCSENTAFSTELSKRIINAKINNQLIVLKRYAKNKAVSVEDEIRLIKAARAKALEAKDYEELIGYEGTAAKYYFRALSKLIKPEFAFKGRNRMPPKDPFNSMLSLGYTLLLYEIYGEIENRGLTPFCGFLHKDHERHPTLASDLMEEWRAVIVDSVVLSLIQGNEIGIDAFVKDDENNGIFLTKKGMKIFLDKYERKMRTDVRYINSQSMSIRRCLWHQVNELVKACENEDASLYSPILIR